MRYAKILLHGKENVNMVHMRFTIFGIKKRGLIRLLLFMYSRLSALPPSNGFIRKFVIYLLCAYKSSFDEKWNFCSMIY